MKYFSFEYSCKDIKTLAVSYLIFTATLERWRGCSQRHLTNGVPKAQRDSSFVWSCSWKVAEPGLEPGLSPDPYSSDLSPKSLNLTKPLDPNTNS